jgi:hypothetical protein
MKQLIFQVAVGKQNILYEICIKSVAKYCKKFNIDHIVLREPKLKIRPDLNRTGRSKEAVERLGYLPIFEKENAFEYLKPYDQVCIVDSDIYIKDTAPNVFDELPQQYDFGGCVEREMPLTKKYFNKIRKYFLVKGISLSTQPPKSYCCGSSSNTLGAVSLMYMSLSTMHT